MLRNLTEQPLAIVIIVVAIVLLFGYKRLPDAARSIGRSMRIFKSEVKEMKNDGSEGKDGTGATARTSARTEPLEGRVVSEDHPPRTDPLDDGRPVDSAHRDA